MNREAWLTELAKRSEPFFRGFALGDYAVTCGWPSHGAIGSRRLVVGQCHYPPEKVKDGRHQLFVSPLVHKPDEVAGIVLHEMAHIAAGHKAGHGKGYVAVCRHVGLTKGKATQAAPGERLAEALKKITDALGEYPHKPIVPVTKVKKASSVLSLTCAACGCKVVISLKWLNDAGKPSCACGSPFLTPDEQEEDNE